MLTLPYYLHCALTALAAVVVTGLLTAPGMLLAPVAEAVRGWYWQRFNADPDHCAWLKPMGLCPTCATGQWVFLAYLCHYGGAAYSFPEHVYFVALGLLFSLLFQWTINRLKS